MTLRKKYRTVKIISISTELFVQPACSVCEDGAGENGGAQWSAFDFREVHMVESTVREI